MESVVIKNVSVNILKPQTWIRYRKGLCRNCQAGCCTLPVRVDAEDLFHMGYLQIYEVNGPLKRIASRLKKKGIIANYHSGSKTFLLKQKPNHDCIFLNDKRLCTIYERRPAVCRAFPQNSVRPGYCPSVVVPLKVQRANAKR